MPNTIFIVCSLLPKDEKADINVFDSEAVARTCSVYLSTRRRAYPIHEKEIKSTFGDSNTNAEIDDNNVYLVFYPIPGNNDIVFHAFNNEDAAKACHKFYDERIHGPVFLEKHEILKAVKERFTIKEKNNG